MYMLGELVCIPKPTLSHAHAIPLCFKKVYKLYTVEWFIPCSFISQFPKAHCFAFGLVWQVQSSYCEVYLNKKFHRNLSHQMKSKQIKIVESIEVSSNSCQRKSSFDQKEGFIDEFPLHRFWAIAKLFRGLNQHKHIWTSLWAIHPSLHVIRWTEHGTFYTTIHACQPIQHVYYSFTIQIHIWVCLYNGARIKWIYIYMQDPYSVHIALVSSTATSLSTLLVLTMLNFYYNIFVRFFFSRLPFGAHTHTAIYFMLGSKGGIAL